VHHQSDWNQVLILLHVTARVHCLDSSLITLIDIAVSNIPDFLFYKILNYLPDLCRDHQYIQLESLRFASLTLIKKNLYKSTSYPSAL
jgi:hypothetical protein